jgi:hypothetical protein
LADLNNGIVYIFEKTFGEKKKQKKQEFFFLFVFYHFFFLRPTNRFIV